jgi:hypothetical protein
MRRETLRRIAGLEQKMSDAFSALDDLTQSLRRENKVRSTRPPPSCAAGRTLPRSVSAAPVALSLVEGEPS